MKATQRKALNRLMVACGFLGNELDGTSTSPRKYIDRQAAHRYVSQVVYSVLVDDPENDQREDDLQKMEESLKKLEELAKKNYPDRNGQK